MNPLAEYLLKVIKAEPNLETRRAEECEIALAELGFWLLSRPVNMTVDAMPTKIAEQCLFVESFRHWSQPLVDCEPFEVMVDMYVEPNEVFT